MDDNEPDFYEQTINSNASARTKFELLSTRFKQDLLNFGNADNSDDYTILHVVVL